MVGRRKDGPDQTAVRTALWRALHLEVDAEPHVLHDRVGLQLAAPDDDWRRRPDMHARGTARARAAIVARARFIEDLIVEQAARGLDQYVLLGAGLDSFAQRRPEVASRMQVFEIDRPGPQAWKRRRLTELGFGIPDWLHLVPVDFETGASWWDELKAAGFDPGRPAIVASTGVAMYLTREANTATLAQAAALAPGSTFAMTFMLPLDAIDAEERPSRQNTEKFARLAGTPFLSFFLPDEISALALEAGFREVRHVSCADTAQFYFTGRTDGLRPSSAEELLIAKT
jgi:methyltransferase (TIGR00027 family)